MSMQIVGMDFKDVEDDGDDQEITAIEALGQGKGINLRCQVDLETFLSFSKLITEGELQLFGEEPDTFIIEHEFDGSGSKLTPYTGHPQEGGVAVPEHEAILGESTITFKKELPVIIAPDPSSLDGLYVKIGSNWLNMQAGGETNPDDAAAWEEFCQALTERNTRNEDSRRERGEVVSYAPRVSVDTLFTDIASFGPVTNANTHTPRRGPKIQARPALRLRVPTSEFMKDAMMGLSRGEFTPTEGLDGVFTLIGDTQLRIECDDASGLDTVRAVEMLATYGPATMQTFLGLMGLWLEHNPGASHETYFTVRASDLMRFMHRRETAGGGYNTDDQMQKGREVFILSRATVPRATTKVHRAGKLTVQTLSVDRLIHVQTLAAQRTLEEGKEIQSILEFRYHPNKEMHEMLCGDTPQFAEVSGKLLAYHPAREKYQIVLGFGLAFYDRVNRKYAQKPRKIELLSLLALAGIPVPIRNFPRFLDTMQKAVEALSADGVIPGAVLSFPDSSALSGRHLLAKAVVTFPPLSTALISVEAPALMQ